MGLLSDCEKHFGTKNLYEVLDITPSASQKEVKKAYYKQSLKTHPDKADADSKEEANKLFQTVSQVYEILNDEEKRAIYDESGQVDSDTSDDKDWMEYWRVQFPKIQLKDILEFEKQYKGSEDEKNDLKTHYLRFKGNFDKIGEYHLCYSIDEEGRYRKLIDQMIEKEEVPKFAAYKPRTKLESLKRQKKAAREAMEAKHLATKLGLNMEADDTESLAVAIKKKKDEREKGFDSFLSNLEAKYCKPAKTAKGKGRKK